MSDKNDSESHIRTIKDLFAIIEPYLTVEDIQEIIEDLEDMREEEQNEKANCVGKDVLYLQ